MTIFAFLTAIFASLLILFTSISFLKSKDVFTMTHVVMIYGCYVVPLTLIAIEIERFSLISFIKILALILLNLVIVNLVCNATARRAIINKIVPDAKTLNSDVKI